MSTTGATAERHVALAVARRVREGAFADRAFAGEARRAALDPQTRAQAHRLAFGAVQRRRTLDWLIDAKVRAPAGLEPDVREVLRIAAYEIGWSDAVPGPVAVDQAVRLVGTLSGDARRRAARRGLVNAVARALLVDTSARLAELRDDSWESAAVRHSVPDWIARDLFADLGAAAAAAVLAAANEPGESTVRWNPAGGGRVDFDALLPPGSTRCAAPFDAMSEVPGAFALEDSPIWREGRGMGQSRGSLLPVLALAPTAGERILDLCAAPGAKATAIAAAVGEGGSVVAVELHEARARAVRELAERLHVRLDVVAGDGRVADVGTGFDAVLVDAPCSGLGVLGSRPDLRWRRREESVAELAVLQGELVRRALQVVKPGGRVVYSTCTLLARENEDVVRGCGAALDDLAASFPDFAHPGLAGALRTLPGRDGTDGFFIARLRPEPTR